MIWMMMMMMRCDFWLLETYRRKATNKNCYIIIFLMQSKMVVHCFSFLDGKIWTRTSSINFHIYLVVFFACFYLNDDGADDGFYSHMNNLSFFFFDKKWSFNEIKISCECTKKNVWHSCFSTEVFCNLKKNFPLLNP